MRSLLFKSLALSVGLFGAAAGVMAATDVTTCPSPEFIQNTVIDDHHAFFTEIDVSLISFDVKTNLFSTLVSTFNMSDDGAEAFIMANTKGTAEQNWEEIAVSCHNRRVSACH